MAKIYKVNTGISSFSTSYTASIRDRIFEIINPCFLGDLHKENFGDNTQGFTGPGLSAANMLCVEADTSNQNYHWKTNDWGNARDYENIYDTSNSGPLCIYYTYIQNGVLIGICGENDNYLNRITTAFFKNESNGHVISLRFNVPGTEISYRDLFIADFPSHFDSMPKASPSLKTLNVSMSKMLLGSTIRDDIYVATTMPNASTSARSFIIDDKEYISIAQPSGYCPAVFKCANS